MKIASALFMATVFATSQAFALSTLPRSISFNRKTSLSSSRLDGNQGQPTNEDITVIDEMITKMAEAKPYELPNAVQRAFRVCSSPRFFLRIAERTDQATDNLEKEKLSALASNLAATVEAVVSTTQDQLDERAKDVEDIVKQASEPSSGEFLVPLSNERIEAMREALVKYDPSKLDESFLSTVDSWIVKSHQDGMDGMVGILQRLLQQYAGLQVSRARALQQQEEGDDKSKSADELFEKLLACDTENWNQEIVKGTSEVSPSSLVAAIQKTMETVILGLENGTMSQRIQAEYLKELVDRVEALKQSKA